MDHAKPFLVAKGPLVVVQKWPVEEALHIGAVCNCAFGRQEVVGDELGARGVIDRAVLYFVVPCHSVLGDIDRQVAEIVTGSTGQKVVEPVWVNFPAHLGRSVAAEEADPSALIHHCRRAIALRHAHKALSVGGHTPLQTAGNIVYFTRIFEGTEIFCAFNVGNDAGNVALPKGDWTAIAADIGGAQDIASGHVKLYAWQVCIATRKA